MSGQANWNKLWSAGFVYGPLDGWAKEIFLAVGDLLNDCDDPAILSAGCGRGLIDYWLLQVFGWRVTLFDNSEQCIKNLRRSFRKVDGGRYEIIHGSILDIPFPDGSFDLVWNEGVLEHFQEAEYHKALGEMARVSKRFVLVDVPNANCRPYLLVKEWLEANGKWDWGHEQPRSSLRRDLEDLGITVLSERSIGGRRTINNYLHMVPLEHRKGILDRLRPEEFESFPHLLTIGTKHG